MLFKCCKTILRLFGIFVLSGLSSVAVSQTFNFTDALALIDDEGFIVVPDTYTSIGNSAFSYTSVVDVTLPESIQSIGQYAFSDTPNLRKINIPSSITTINVGVFENSGIEEIHIPDHIARIEDYAFQGSNLLTIELPPNIYIDNYAFYSSALKHLKIGDNTSVGNSAFASLANLLSLELGANVGSSSSAYQGMHNLKTLITSTNVGCNQCYSGITFGNDSGNSLTTVILRNDVSLRALFYYKSYSRNVDIFVEADNSGNSNASTRVEANSVTVISPYEVTYPIAVGPHGVCSLGDNDNDGYNDCYDQFPNDSDRWFEYGESPETNTTNLVHSDNDGLADIFDQYPTINNVEGFGENRDQSEYELDTDYDGINNYQDIDDDDDGLLDIYEPFYGTNPLIPDSDFDGTLDGLDAFPLDNTESLDTDSDGIGNNADTDDDNDGHLDLLDAFPVDASEWMDSDLDGVGNNADTDDDNDGVLDEEDAFPFTASESVDNDGDGVGDNADAFPNDSSESLDTDLDGIGNNEDPDDDNDGVADAEDSDPLNDAIGALESQNLFVMGNPVAVNGYLSTISVGYDVSDANNQLTGIGFRVHYDSEIFSLSAVENILSDSVVVGGMGPYQDIEDFDNDGTTDSYLVFGWASINGDWPNTTLAAKLSDIQFFVNWNNYEAASSTSTINFSVVDNSQGYEANAANYSINVLPATWDFDGDGTGDALTDGLMLLRYVFGVPSVDITTGALSANATLSPPQVVDGIKRAMPVADIDGNGSTDALTDGLLLLRYLFSLRGDMLIGDAVSPNATRTTAEEIEQYIELYMPDGLMPPVQSEQNFMVGDWKLAAIPQKKEVGQTTTWGDLWSYTQSVFESCVADDIYRFGEDGTFEYLINGSTYMSSELNPLYEWNNEGPSSCASPLAPWNESDIYTYSFDENNSLLTVIGRGAYIALAHVANGTDDLETAADAPESISYDYTKISDTEILLEIDAFDDLYRYTLERVLGN